MRQLRDRPKTPLNPIAPRHERVEVPSPNRSPILLFGLMFFAAVGAGYVGTHLLKPVNLVLVVVMAAGGASAMFLAFAIPAQAILFLRKVAIRLGLVVKRGRLHNILEAAQSALMRETGAGRSAAALGDLALVAYLRGAAEAAQRDLAQALEMEPDNPALLNNLGVALIRLDDYDRAAELFARASTLNGCGEARLNLGLVAPLASRDDFLARLVADRTSASDALVLNNVGVYHLKQGNLDVGAEWFSRALRQDPRHACALANLGLVAYRRGRLRDGIGHLVRAARAAPEDARIANDLGVALAAVGKAAWSREQLARAHALAPTNVGIRINMMSVAALEGRIEGAIRGLRGLTGAAHHRDDVHYNLAVLQLATDDYEGAAESAAAAIEAGESGPDAYTNLGVALWGLGRRQEALSHFQAAWHGLGANPRAAVNLGRALMLTGRDTRQAVEVLEQARERWRSDPDIALDLATALLADAVSRFRRDMTPTDRREFFAELHRSYAGLEAATRRGNDVPVEARINMALYFYLREEYLQAAEQLEAAIKAAPDITQLHHLAGTVYATAADQQRYVLEDGTRTITAEGLELVRRAAPHLEKACEPRDASPDSFYNLGRALYALGEYERALEVFRKALRIEDSEAMNALAALAAARQARKWQDSVKTQSLMPEGKKQALTKRARQLMDTAVQYFRQALLHNELNPSLHGNIGLAYMLRNQEHDVEAALRHWQRMRAIAGTELARRYSEFTQIQSIEHAARVQYDDREVACRPIDVAQWVTTAPPDPAPLHYVLEPVSEQREWRLVTANEELQRALAVRDTIAAGMDRLARLEA